MLEFHSIETVLINVPACRSIFPLTHFCFNLKKIRHWFYWILFFYLRVIKWFFLRLKHSKFTVVGRYFPLDFTTSMLDSGSFCDFWLEMVQKYFQIHSEALQHNYVRTHLFHLTFLRSMFMFFVIFKRHRLFLGTNDLCNVATITQSVWSNVLKLQEKWAVILRIMSVRNLHNLLDALCLSWIIFWWIWFNSISNHFHPNE